MSDKARYISGTIAQLVGKISFGGTILGQPELSVMTRVFEGTIFKQIGTIRKESRGRPSAIWLVDSGLAAFVEFGDNATALLTDDVPVVAEAEAA